jgi:GTP cyclohydrolase IB
MSPTSAHLPIPDTQSERDERHLAIHRVGVKRVRFPLLVKLPQGVQPSVGEWTLDVALPAEQKGTHMSRFVAWLEQGAELPLDAAGLRERHLEMLERLHAAEGVTEVSFALFEKKRAPVSGIESRLDLQARWTVETRAGETTLWQEVAVPVKSLCPCSKEISDYGAHNQRSMVTLRIEWLAAKPLPFSAQMRFAEDSASSEIWPLLKRADEKWVTERAYENPKFVEDLIRDVALRLNADERVGRYQVEVENFESIHNHSAYARMERA